MNAIAKDGYQFVLTQHGYDTTPDNVKHEREVGKPVPGWPADCVPASWVDKWYVEEVLICQSQF